MSEIWFYHLERTPLDRVLPDLLTKTLDRGWRAIVRAGSAERVQALDSHLWTYQDESFLPHGTAAQGQAAHQPVLLTTGEENPNGAQALFLVDGADFPELETGAFEAFERCILLFDGTDQEALASARAAWKQAKDHDLETSYWQQTPQGRWEKKA